MQGERLRAERDLGVVSPNGKLTKEQIKNMVLQLWDIASVLATADPKLKQEVYAELGVRVTDDPHRRVIGVSAGPCTTDRVGGGIAPSWVWLTSITACVTSLTIAASSQVQSP